jgi:hypothetical protein
MRRLQIYGTASATANGVAQVTIPASSKLKSISYSLNIDSITDNSLVRLELIKVPTTQIGVNGALDPFFQLGAFGNFVTSGLTHSNVAGQQRVDVDMRQGEIVYLHCMIAGTGTFYFNGILWLTN